MQKPLIVVGIGDHLLRDLRKPIEELQEQGVFTFSYTVDLKGMDALAGEPAIETARFFAGVEHVVRSSPEQKFHEALPGVEPTDGLIILDIRKSYYSVIRAGCEIIGGNSPYRFDSNQVCLDTQGLLFEVLDRIEDQRESMPRYATGTAPEQIFKNPVLS